jgi:hypothetical protein
MAKTTLLLLPSAPFCSLRAPQFAELSERITALLIQEGVESDTDEDDGLDAGDADHVDSDARQAPDAGHIGVLQNALNNRQGSTLAWETARPSNGHERDTRSRSLKGM